MYTTRGAGDDVDNCDAGGANDGMMGITSVVLFVCLVREIIFCVIFVNASYAAINRVSVIKIGIDIVPIMARNASIIDMMLTMKA
jgi:hypothetical protein